MSPNVPSSLKLHMGHFVAALRRDPSCTPSAEGRGCDPSLAHCAQLQRTVQPPGSALLTPANTQGWTSSHFAGKQTRQHASASRPCGVSVSSTDSQSNVQTCHHPYFRLASRSGESPLYFLCFTGTALFFLTHKGRCSPGPRGTE